MTYTTQKQIRAAFWEAHPTLPRIRIRRGWSKAAPPVYRVFVDFVDHLEKSGLIARGLAYRATLER